MSQDLHWLKKILYYFAVKWELFAVTQTTDWQSSLDTQSYRLLRPRDDDDKRRSSRRGSLQTKVIIRGYRIDKCVRDSFAVLTTESTTILKHDCENVY